MTNWLSPPKEFKLSLNQVDIWQADLNVSPQQLGQFQLTLSEDEQQRAQRFRFERDRSQYIAARGILRSLLGQYLGVHPAQLQFNYSNKGKPTLSPVHVTQPIQFNVSHSHQKALYGITLNHRVGIDLEYMRPVEVLSLAQRFFSKQEFTQLTAVSPQQQQQVFFQLWTGKEAYLKATGEGLSGLENIELSLDNIQGFDFNCPDKMLSKWSIIPLNINNQYVASLAVEGELLEYRCWQWQSISSL
jgi:4'-phosphopantetheinyl transferase